MRILVLVAHPDDEAILCGGTIDKATQRGDSVDVVFYTRNDEAFFGKETRTSRRKRTVHEARQSSKVLNYRPHFLNLEDMNLAKDPRLLLTATIRQIRLKKPDIIITHNDRDRHIDHRTLGQIVPEANFQSGNKLSGGNSTWTAGLVLCGEVDLEMTAPFDFDLVSELSPGNLKMKIKAFSQYLSVNDEHSMDQKWLNQKLQITARLRGHSAGVNYGEAFRVNNYVPLNARGVALLKELVQA